jgi:hypothetical protein
VIDKDGYGRFPMLSREDLERYCYLDDEDRRLIAGRRRADTRLGFAVQVVTVRNLGMFLADPLDVPVELVEYLAEQLGIDDPSCVTRYTEREKTKLEHVSRRCRPSWWRGSLIGRGRPATARRRSSSA